VKGAERKGYSSVIVIGFCYQTQLYQIRTATYSFNTVFLVEGKLMTMSRNLVPRSNIHIMKPRKKERKRRKEGRK
jgi:hypothetical protein